MSETTSPRQAERINELFTVLADGERLAIITHLQELPTENVSLEMLAAVLAPDSHTARDNARIRLHHVHLPKLDETDLLSYDPNTTTVEYHGHPELESLLETILHSDTDTPT